MGKRSREKRTRRTDAPSQPQPVRATARSESAERRPALPYDGPMPPRDTDAARWPADRTAALVLFGLAFAVRIVVLIQLASTPYFQVGNIDSTAYDQWADRLVGGDWLPHGTFYQSPLYAYFLAVLRMIFG